MAERDIEAECDIEYEFLRIAAANSPPPDERQLIIVEASKDRAIDKVYLVGSQGYPEARRQLAIRYLLSRPETDEAISLGVRRIADEIREQHLALRRKLDNGEA